MEALEQAAAVAALAPRLDAARGSVLVLSGAGLSTASGLPDFRSAATGLWGRVDPTVLADVSSLATRPGDVWDFYAWRVGLLADAAPNTAHHAIARLVAAGVVRTVATQNVDGLHAAAGTDAIELHGSLRTARCLACGATEPIAAALARRTVREAATCAACGAVLKPGVVMFGESLPRLAWRDAAEAAARAAAVLAVGTSLAVAPANQLPDLAPGPLLLCTRERAPGSPPPAIWSDAPLEELLPALADALGA